MISPNALSDDATLVAEALRLKAQGSGNRSIGKAIGWTNNKVRHRLIKAQTEGKASVPAEIDVAACRASPAARKIKAAHVDVLAHSILQIGLIQPISVRAIGNGFEVIAGLHRLRAFEKLGRNKIPAIVRDSDDLRAELALIDENLIRNELSPIERDIAVARRKAIYEILHPETVNGATGRARQKVRQVGEANEPAERFSRATAEATGCGERTIQRSVARVESIGEETLRGLVDTSLNEGAELDALAQLSPEGREEIIARASAGEKVSAKVAVKKERRNERERKLGERQQALPEIKAGLILEDYEWDDEVWSRDTGMDRHAANHYPTSVTAHTAEEIVARRSIESIVDTDCVLAMWTTVQHLAIALKVMELRKFEYKSHYIWAKDHISLGRWVRSKHEILLIGTRGSPVCPAPGQQWASLIEAPKSVHSAKPDIFLEMLEEYFPTIVKVELNRRGVSRPGWAAWGNEALSAHDLETVDSLTSCRKSERVNPS